jgi:hypothetical protein
MAAYDASLGKATPNTSSKQWLEFDRQQANYAGHSVRAREDPSRIAFLPNLELVFFERL